MMPEHKMQLLALHGKGTSARIMKAQIKPLVDLLDNVLDVHYMDGGETSAPYQGIESIFPNESYYAWYQQPTRDALRDAHRRIAERLSPTFIGSLKPNGGKMVPITTNFERSSWGVFTPPETPTSVSPSFPLARAPLDSLLTVKTSLDKLGYVANSSRQTGRLGIEQRIPGIDTPLSHPSTAGARTPVDVQLGRYDGMICFSQGCAVATGLLLEMGTRLSARLVILICGGRPFDIKGTMERVETTRTTPIEKLSIHIHGRQDAGLDESRKLASLYSDRGKQVIELDIGHCPPRRTSDIQVVAAAVRRAIAELS
ncbi:hypothetical protein EX895_004192 [Sporisorium graminicola]|uniref:Serine hydrolase domain-containing protein n=1 Tax=Sporisorium graminicola TaxID=280036 RepID=A0A4U7KR42_9BASI|nr:hypothetical protein EX895_004192 [Sporisorium graminicola]TKY86904.1 hypothetical protein EX895_004192 [Sporisorium graminicola]